MPLAGGETFYLHPSNIGSQSPIKNRLLFTPSTIDSENKTFVVVKAILEYY